jgi:pectinesterase
MSGRLHRRRLIGAMATFPLAAFAGARALRAEEKGYDAVVGGRDPGAYPTLGAALGAAPVTANQPFRVLVTRGTWKEKVTVAKPLVHLIGEDRAASVITFDAASGHKGPNGEPFGTRGCATLTVQAPGFRARNLTIANGFDYVGNLLKAEDDPTRLKDPQGVALMLDEGSDRALVEDVDLTGHQDTLFIDRGLSLFRRCRIAGSVDFVFGAGRSLLSDCEIVSRFRPGKPRQGYLAAPSTPRSQPYGLVFHDCPLTKEAQVPAESVVLGRPWRPGRTFADGRYGDPEAVGNAAFIRCWMDDHISADGWDEMGFTAKSGDRVFLKPDEARLYEYESRGPGARHGNRRRKLEAAEAARYALEFVLDGWRP